MDQDKAYRGFTRIFADETRQVYDKDRNQKKKAKSESSPKKHKMSSGVNQSLEVEKQPRIAQEVMDEYRETLALLAKK
jgi:hypothetical protein